MNSGAESPSDPVTVYQDMADNVAGEHEKEDSFVESVKDKISETFHKDDSSSSSDSDNEGKKSSSVSDVKDKIYRLFGREKPVHKLLGGGKRMHIFSCCTYF